MYDNYDDASNASISRQQAKAEIAKHDADTMDRSGHVHDTAWQAFLADAGDFTRYSGHEVLDWLGY